MKKSAPLTFTCMPRIVPVKAGVSDVLPPTLMFTRPHGLKMIPVHVWLLPLSTISFAGFGLHCRIPVRGRCRRWSRSIAFGTVKNSTFPVRFPVRRQGLVVLVHDDLGRERA